MSEEQRQREYADARRARVFYQPNKGPLNYYDTHLKGPVRPWSDPVQAAYEHFGIDPSKARQERALLKRHRKRRFRLIQVKMPPPLAPILEEPGSKREALMKIIKQMEAIGGGNIVVVGPDGQPGVSIKGLAEATMAHTKKKIRLP